MMKIRPGPMMRAVSSWGRIDYISVPTKVGEVYHIVYIDGRVDDNSAPIRSPQEWERLTILNIKKGWWVYDSPFLRIERDEEP